MSHQENDKYNEELEILETDYQDSLKSLSDARKDLRDALDWENQMYLNVNENSRRLKEFKNQL